MQEAIFVLVSIISASQGYPNGPPNAACADATPQHADFTPEVKESCPYLVVAERFVPGEKMILNITSWSGVETFRGFQLTVFEPETYRAMGSFGKDERTICNGAAATHSEGEKKLFYELDWTPPKDSSGQIYIIWLTIVQSFSKFWTDCDHVQLAAMDANVEFTTPAWFEETAGEKTIISSILDTTTVKEVAPKTTTSRISTNAEEEATGILPNTKSTTKTMQSSTTASQIETDKTKSSASPTRTTAVDSTGNTKFTNIKTPSQLQKAFSTTDPQNSTSTTEYEKTTSLYQNVKISNEHSKTTKAKKEIKGGVRHLNSATKHTATTSQTMCILFAMLLFY